MVNVKEWVVNANVVPSPSMYPTIPAVSKTASAYILDNKLQTELHPIFRGEVVVFHFPDNPSLLFVKRIVGLPGDTVTITETAVYINGTKLAESNPNISADNGKQLGTYHVPPNHYFMLGDNRPVSDDSRMWLHKYVARSAIVGEASFVLYPWSKMGGIRQSL